MIQRSVSKGPFVKIIKPGEEIGNAKIEKGKIAIATGVQHHNRWSIAKKKHTS